MNWLHITCQRPNSIRYDQPTASNMFVHAAVASLEDALLRSDAIHAQKMLLMDSEERIQVRRMVMMAVKEPW